MQFFQRVHTHKPRCSGAVSVRALVCLAAALACVATPAAPPVRRAAGSAKEPEPIRPVSVPVGGDPRLTVIGDIDFRQLPMYQAARLASELTQVNVVSTAAASEVPVTLFLRRTTIQALMDNLARVTGLWYRYDKDTNTYLLMTAEEFRRDVVVYRSDVTRVFPMKYYNVVSAATSLRALYGRRVQLAASVEEPLGISALGSPLSAQRTASSGGGVNPAVSSNNRNSTTNGGGGGGGYGGGDMGGQGMGAMWQPPISYGNDNGRGANDDKAGGLDKLSQGRASTLSDINQGEVSRVSKADLETLDQTRESPVYVTYNRLHNLLIVRSGDEKLIAEIATLVERIDRPARQVLLEVKVLELTMGDTFSSAFDLNVDVNGRGLSTTSGSSATGAGIFEVFNRNIRARLELLQSQNRVRVLSTPVLMASNNQPSRLFIGSEQVLVTGVSTDTVTNTSSSSVNVTATTERRDIGNQLIIVPRINDDRTVTLSIDQDNSTLNRGGASIPVVVNGGVVGYPIDTVNTSNMQATVLAKDGYTAAVGGLIRDSISKQEQKVPGLGDVPVLGYFFRSQADVQSKTETVLLITPHILETAEEAQAVSRDLVGRRSQQSNAVVDDNLPPLPGSPSSAPEAPRAPTYYFEQMDGAPSAASANPVLAPKPPVGEAGLTSAP
ncbi:MAG TPA: hypothetical protein VGC24_07200 [Burkholderiaceae bacterium]